jgi:predicted MPP superfamily phosphohydrolase
LKLIDIVDHSDKVYLLPLGDLHLGASVDMDKFQGYINWAKANKAYIFFMGDLFDTATLTSPTEVWGQTMNLNNAIKFLRDLLEPVQKQIIGAITGNHEKRLIKYANFDPVASLCDQLNVEYAKYSAVLRFRIGTHKRTKLNIVSPKIEYVFYAHHSKGGGATIGGKINRAKKLADIFEGADAYLIGHNHGKGMMEDSVAHLIKSGNGKASIGFRRIQYVDCGSFLTYDDSYAEEGMLPPSDTGCPRIRMNGIHKDLHISF